MEFCLSIEGKYSPNDKDEERGEKGEEEKQRREQREREREGDEIWRNRGKERNIDYQDVCTCLACANMLAVLQF